MPHAAPTLPPELRALAPIAADARDEQRPRWGAWAAVLALALLLHALLLWLNPDWREPAAPPRPVEIQRVDPAKLDAIRKQWARDKALLLNKDKNLPKDQVAPPDARYMSDRNIRVEREQRARQTDVLPRPGAKTQPQPQAAPQEQAKASEQQRRAAPKLGQLGVPLNLGEKRPQEGTRARRTLRSAEDPGADQAIRDPNVPLGSENLLNAQESIYYSFYSRLYEAIGPIWQSNIRRVGFLRRVMPGEYTTVVEVVFDRQGNLLEVRQMQSSGVPEFDRAVPDSWKKIGSFPNPPSGLLDRNGQVHTGWTFTVTVNQEMGVQYEPPERVY